MRRFKVTHAARHDGRELGALLDRSNLASGVWADTAYRSQANLTMMERPPRLLSRNDSGLNRVAGRCPSTSGGATRPGPGCEPKVEHVFAAEKHGFRLAIRTIGLARAKAKIALSNLT